MEATAMNNDEEETELSLETEQTYPIVSKGFASCSSNLSPDEEPSSELTVRAQSAIGQLDEQHPFLDVATVLPWANYIYLNAAPPPADASFHRWDERGMANKAMLKLEAISFREELMHGERQQFGLVRNAHLIQREQIQALFRFLAEDISASSAARLIENTQRILNAIDNVQRPFVEAVDKYLIVSVLREQTYDHDLNQYLADTAELYEDVYEDANKEEIVQFLEYELERIEWEVLNGRVEANQEIFEALRTIEEKYDRNVAEAVADVTLDIPQLIKQVATFGYDGETISVEEIDLSKRFESVRQQLDVIDNPDSYGRNSLRAELESRLNERDGGKRLRVVQDMHLPLLDTPRETIDENESQQGYGAIREAPSELGRLVAGSLRFIGNFGAVVYNHEDGKSNWLINPWVETEPVETPFTANTYGELWQQFYLGRQFVLTAFSQAVSLEETAESKNMDPIEVIRAFDENLVDVPEYDCPFCEISKSGRCGENGCGCESYEELMNVNRDALLRGLFETRSG